MRPRTTSAPVFLQLLLASLTIFSVVGFANPASATTSGNPYHCPQGGPNAMTVDRVVWTNKIDSEYVVVGSDIICSSKPDPCPLGARTSIDDLGSTWIQCGQTVFVFCPLENNSWYRYVYLNEFTSNGDFWGWNTWSGAAPAPSLMEAGSVLELTYLPEFAVHDAQTLRLYWAFFEREPDLAGSKYWLGLVRSGVSLDEIAYNFAVSAEFQLRYGNTTDRRFLEIVYQNVLGRTYDQAGFDYWLDLLETGQLNRGGVVRWVAAGLEFERQHPYPNPAARDAQPPYRDPDYPCAWQA